MREVMQAAEILPLVKLNCAHNGISDGRPSFPGFFVRNVETGLDHVLPSQLLQHEGVRLL